METENKEKKPEEKKKIIVKYYSGKWEVSNDGDSAILFSSDDKESAVKFGKSVADSHNVKIEIKDESKKEVEDKERKEKTSEEKSSKDVVKAAIRVFKDRDEWVVKTEDDSAVLFSSGEKEPAIKFANQMGKVHGVKVTVED